MPQKPWISIVKLLIVLGGFATVIIVIARTLSHNCNDNTKMFDKGMNECRKICDYDTKPGCTDCTHWDYATKTCKLCPVGMTWNNDTGVCVQNCNDNGGWWGGSEGLQYNNSGCMCSSSFLGTNCSVFNQNPQESALGYMQCDLLTTASKACAAAAANGKVGPGCCPAYNYMLYGDNGTCKPASTLDGLGSRCVTAPGIPTPAPIMVITATDQSGHVVHSGIPTNADYLNVTFLCYMSTPPVGLASYYGSAGGIPQEVAPGKDNFTEDSVVLECSTGISTPPSGDGEMPGPTSCRCQYASYFNSRSPFVNNCNVLSTRTGLPDDFTPTCWDGSPNAPSSKNCQPETLKPSLMSEFTPVFGPGADWPIAPNPRNYKFTARINKPEWANLTVGDPELSSNAGGCPAHNPYTGIYGKDCLMAIQTTERGGMDGRAVLAKGYVTITVPKNKFKNVTGTTTDANGTVTYTGDYNVASVPFEWWFCAREDVQQYSGSCSST